MRRFVLFFMIGIVLIFAVGCGTSDATTDSNHADEMNNKEETPQDVKEKSEESSEGEKESEKDKDKKSSDSNSKATSSDKKDTQNTKTSETQKDNNSKKKATNNSSKSKSNSKASSSNSSNKSKSKDNSSSKSTSKSKNSTSNSSKSSKQSKSSDTSKQTKPKENKKKDPVEKPQKDVTVSVTSGDVKGTILSGTNVSINEGDTALHATARILKEKSIQHEVTGAGYVKGIDNLYEFDEGPLSGWQIRIDGVLINHGAGAATLKGGENIKWSYTTDYTKESK